MLQSPRADAVVTHARRESSADSTRERIRSHSSSAKALSPLGSRSVILIFRLSFVAYCDSGKCHRSWKTRLTHSQRRERIRKVIVLLSSSSSSSSCGAAGGLFGQFSHFLPHATHHHPNILPGGHCSVCASVLNGHASMVLTRAPL